MKTVGNTIKSKKMPFFKKGSLAYEASKHPLELSGRHYRCMKHCKSNTGKTQIKKENLERNFSRFAKKFQIKKEEGRRIFDSTLNEFMNILLAEMGEKVEQQDEIIDATKAVVKQDLEKDKITNSNIKILKDAYVKQADGQGGLILFGILAGCLVSFSHPKNETEMGRDVSFITKHVNLSNDGKIISIELESWGWYVLNFMNKKIPNYLFNLRENSVKIVNKEEPFCKLNLLEAIHHFEKEGIDKALGDNPKNAYDTFFVEFKKLFGVLGKGDKEEIKKQTLMLFESIENDPKTNFAFKMSKYL